MEGRPRMCHPLCHTQMVVAVAVEFCRRREPVRSEEQASSVGLGRYYILSTSQGHVPRSSELISAQL